MRENLTTESNDFFHRVTLRFFNHSINSVLSSLSELCGKKNIAFAFILFTISLKANVIKVATAKDLQEANANAKTGDTIILENGNWNNISLKLTCKGTEKAPIVFKAETNGKVKITGTSSLKIGGNYIVVEGLNFEKGYSTENAIIAFKTDKNNVANNCRVTNCLINEFNKPLRLDDDYWVALCGKKNRIDHCTFRNKKNLGVLMAVILDDEKSRENFHSIDHNFFDGRQPLGSNAGEIIRVGVSQHCTFNSNTIIADNYFKNCDGETEIISIKSGANIIKNNLFETCQGCVTLRHGNNNTVYKNIFLGNKKEGTGGVRIINEGNWVINNLFYECVGENFRSPLAIMNGVPNSPANRYLPVKDAVIANNSFISCTPFSLCEGSDKERSQVPQNVLIANNIFFNKKDTLAYYKYDNISGFNFKNNIVGKNVIQILPFGFFKKNQIDSLSRRNPKIDDDIYGIFLDSLKKININENRNVSFRRQIGSSKEISFVKSNSGIQWKETKPKSFPTTNINCSTTQKLLQALSDSINFSKKINIILNSNVYEISEPIKIYNQVAISSNNQTIKFITKDIEEVFEIKGNGSLHLTKLNIDAGSIQSKNFISSPKNLTSNHYNFKFTNSAFKNYKVASSSFFNASKTSYADSLIFNNNIFENNETIFLSGNKEQDKKGYYSAEVIKINNNTIRNHKGNFVQLARTGNDESTMGPKLWIIKNKISNAESTESLIQLNGVQYSNINNNNLINANTGNTLIEYIDLVRAIHIQSKNTINNSGIIKENKFVINK